MQKRVTSDGGRPQQSSAESAAHAATASRRLLVTGATGYIGGRLAPRLLERGYAVRCLVRSEAKLRARPWTDHPNLEIVEGDAGEPGDLDRALRGVETAYYLIHSMVVAGAEYRQRDRRLAENFAAAARRQGVRRIVYLGGLGEPGEGLSDHLSSRREVEHALGSGGVPVTVLRAAMIIGSGSASFEILRYLVERLPVMVTPRWVSTRCQPIAVRDVLHYLAACLEEPATTGETLEIGGPDVVTYLQMMRLMEEARELPRRLILPVPLLTPRLSSHWIHLVTPLSRHIARPLAEGLRNEVVVQDDRAARLMPHQPLPVPEAIRLALENATSHRVETSWSDAGPMPGDPDWAGGSVFQDSWAVEVDATPDEVFEAVCRIGGGNGWYAADWLWRLRGWMDRLIGGPGLRRGRRHPRQVRYGDALDFWRVTEVAEPRRLALRAEMKLPGVARLAFDIDPLEDDSQGAVGVGRTRLIQTAQFIPRGLLGLAYWYAVLPLHYVVFRGMLRGIRDAVEQAHSRHDDAPETAATGRRRHRSRPARWNVAD